MVGTTDGSYKCEDEKNLYILFDWIDGTTPRDNPLTPSQLFELAQIIAELHGFGEENFVISGVLRESYDINFYESLMSRAQNREENIPHEHLSLIIEKLHQLFEVSSGLSAQNLPFVMCHNDIHGWKVIPLRRYDNQKQKGLSDMKRTLNVFITKNGRVTIL